MRCTAAEPLENQQLEEGIILMTSQTNHITRQLPAARFQLSYQASFITGANAGHQNSPATRPCFGNRTSSHWIKPTR